MTRAVVIVCLAPVVALACGPEAPSATSDGTSTTGTSSATTEDSTPTTTNSDTTGLIPLDLGSSEEFPTCEYTFFPVSTPAAEQAVAGDFDGDGVLDLALLADKNKVRLHFGDGSGTNFKPGGEHILGVHPTMAGGDFDGNGTLDLVLYDQVFSDSVFVLLNIDGDLGSPMKTVIDGYFATFRVADVDGDGDADISEGGYGGVPVRVWHANGGLFAEAEQLGQQACFATASDWADMDADGDLDFAVIGDCNGPLIEPAVTVHLRDGGTYVGIIDAAMTETLDPFALEAGDFDGDGKIDLVTHGHEQEDYAPQVKFQFHRGLGDGTFASRIEFVAGDGASVVRSLDADADGFSDVLARGDGLVLHRGTPTGFDPCWVGPGDLLGSGDFDGDGDLDLMIAVGDEVVLARRQ